jgi:hypothetical protein
VLLEFVRPPANQFEIVRQVKYVPTRSVYPNATKTMNVQAFMNAGEAFVLQQKNAGVMVIVRILNLVKLMHCHLDKENA